MECDGSRGTEICIACRNQSYEKLLHDYTEHADPNALLLYGYGIPRTANMTVTAIHPADQKEEKVPDCSHGGKASSQTKFCSQIGHDDHRDAFNPIHRVGGHGFSTTQAEWISRKPASSKNGIKSVNEKPATSGKEASARSKADGEKGRSK